MFRWITAILIFSLCFNTSILSQFGYPDSSSIKDDLNNSLLDAAYDGDFNAIIENLNKGANINAHDIYGQTPLMFVIEKNDLKLVKLFIEKGAKINVNTTNYFCTPPLIIAAKYGYIQIAKYLLENNADISIKDAFGASPLHYASFYNDSTLFSLLMKLHPNPESRTNAGETSLMLAAYNGSTKIVDELIKLDVDINAKDNNGFTPLMAASQNGQYQTVVHLLEAWASVHLMNLQGYSALSLAIANGNTQIADLLLLNKANKNEHNTKNLNPLAIAKIYKQPAIVDSLKRIHAKQNFKPYFRSIQPELGIKINNKDILTGVELLSHDLKFNIDLGIHFYFRPSAIPVLIQRGVDTYYQFWERRNILGLSLAKNMALITTYEKEIGLTAGLNSDVHFGYYRGTDISINSNFQLSPFAGLYYLNHNLGCKLTYSYTNYNITGLYNWYIGFSVFYRFRASPPDINKTIHLKLN